MLVRPSCGLWLRCRESGGGEVLSRLWCRLQYKPLRVFWPCLCLRRYISQDRVSDVHCPPRQFWKSFASTSRYQNSSESVLLCSRLCQGRPTELWNRQNLLCVFRTLHFCFYIVKVKKKTPHSFVCWCLALISTIMHAQTIWASSCPPDHMTITKLQAGISEAHKGKKAKHEKFGCTHGATNFIATIFYQHWY